ncbi:MAG TPA: hypothetical protein VHX68_20320 [Planctomycetaceae bacterium]|nr:hypothetical protein [Planctomycetaceae bacterium]
MPAVVGAGEQGPAEMRKVLIFFCGMIFGAGLISFGFNYHVVYANQGLVVVAKDQAGLNDLYTDIRNWKPSDWQAHPRLLRSLVAHGHSDLISLPGGDSARELLRKFSNAEKENEELQLQ